MTVVPIQSLRQVGLAHPSRKSPIGQFAVFDSAIETSASQEDTQRDVGIVRSCYHVDEAGQEEYPLRIEIRARFCAVDEVDFSRSGERPDEMGED